MHYFGKTLIIFGFILILVGLVFQLLGKVPGIGRLLGDIYIRKGSFTFYFPVVTSLVLSLLLSLALSFFWRR